MKIDPAKALTILANPVKAATLANLIYVTENKLTIERHSKGESFYYTEDGEKIVDEELLAYFKQLVIPPAWQNVRITPLRNGHLQVVGRDDKNRKQYRYHPHWSEIRNKTKFFKMAAFGNVLPVLRNQLQKDMQLPTMTKRKCLALVLRLMEETHIRIGNKYYAKKNKTYGLSTLRTKHLKKENKNIKFTFIGKKGKPNTVSITNNKLRKSILQCEEIPGWELFQYYDEKGDHHTIDSGMVNDYIHELSGDLFSAKDFRTWAASKIFFEYLLKKGIAKSKKKRKKRILKGYDQAAKGLNNTRNVCRTYYVHPFITESYLNESIKPYFDKIDTVTPKKEMTASETILLDLISSYEINIQKEEIV